MRSIVPLLAGFLLLVAVIAATGVLVRTQEGVTEQVRRALEADNALWQLLSSLQDAETGQRGYLLTANPDYLEPYEDAVPLIDGHFERLGLLIGRDEERRAGLRELRRVVDARMAAMNQVLGMAQAGQREEALALVRSGAGKGLMERARDIVTRLQSDEDRALRSARARAERLVDQLEAAILAAILAVMLLAAYSIRDAYRRNRGLVRARDELRAANNLLVQEAASRAAVEEQLRHSQKLEAIGQLTGGMAHDFNNMLAVIIGNLNLIKRRLARGEGGIERYAEQALDGAQRAAALTHRLLAFARRQALSPEPLDVNRLVAGLSEMLSRTLGETIHLETVLAGGLWTTHVDAGQLENAVLNVAINARDAMPEGGRLTIETANAHLDDAYAAAHLQVPPGQYVMLAVSDTGTGMPPEVLAKAFDPFFTTKDAGRGTGLGLSQVHGFVYQSGGHVRIYSEPGAGTTVKIYLPRHYGDGDRPGAGARPREDVPAGDPAQVILVVEDDERVRAMTVDALRDLGYTVIHADGAARALALLEQHPDVRLLFTDIVMPEVNGRQLAERALERRPELKVLFTTGYTRNAVVHNGIVDPGVQLIGKPFTLDQLARKVHEVLRGAPAREGG